MAKKLICVWLTLTILLLSSITIYADDEIEFKEGIFFLKDVVINGEEITNYNLQYPFFLYNDTTYMPLSKDLGNICGFEMSMDWNSRTLTLVKKESTQTQITENWYKNNAINPQVQLADGIKVIAKEISVSPKGVERLAASEELDLSGLPVLVKDKTIFLPIKAFANSEVFKWDIAYNSYFGTSIVTKEMPKTEMVEEPVLNAKKKPVLDEEGNPVTQLVEKAVLDEAGQQVYLTAVDFIDQDKVALRKGLCGYMMAVNSGIYPTLAQKYLAYFERASEVYGADIILLMAVARTESSFTYNAGRSAKGMMQIMPSTAAHYGVTAEQLWDPKTNIDLGAMLIAGKLAMYEGDYSKALVAYNRGVKAVERGTYSSNYSIKALEKYDNIVNYLAERGVLLNQNEEPACEISAE